VNIFGGDPVLLAIFAIVLSTSILFLMKIPYQISFALMGIIFMMCATFVPAFSFIFVCIGGLLIGIMILKLLWGG